jgi:hypothetical protein
MKTATKSRAVIGGFSVRRIWMSRAVGSWLVTLDAFGDVQCGESNYLLDALYPIVRSNIFRGEMKNTLEIEV